ncbi:MAG: 5-formyltetrahydrofolate cyclo-ligase, partial [Hominenteromicrobium sp.]
MTDKRALRQHMQALRQACADRAARDEALFRRAAASSVYRDAECILCYVSFGCEADTSRLLRRALADGKAVFVPRCTPGTHQMDFFRITDPGVLIPGAYGIPEPPAQEALRFSAREKAVCFVPGLAFTAQGMRIGYGKGYYDTFLEKIDVCTVGLCYDFQIVSAIPAEAHDKRMDYVITD